MSIGGGMGGLVFQFGNFALDLTRVVDVRDGCVLLDNYRWYGVGAEAADAIRMAIKAFPDLGERRQGTCGTAQAACPGPDTGCCRTEPASSPARARLQCPSSSVTSFPGHEAPAGEDDAEPAEAEDESWEEEQEQQEEEAPRTWTKVTDEEVDEWVARYAEGEKITDIAQDAGRAYATVYRRIHEKLAEQEVAS